jgi:hypothetical protein
MTAAPVGLAELRATVRGMESRLSAMQHVQVVQLMRLYAELCLRFEADLSATPRDLALAKASALMLVQAVAKAENAA